LRFAISNPVSGITGPYNSAASIGITTGDYTEDGKLYLDTDTLKAALTANPNVLSQLFGATGATTAADGTVTVNSQSEGIAGRLSDTITATLAKLKTIAGTTVTSQYDTSSNLALSITTYNSEITDATDKFSAMQSAYYTQYNAMEVALQSLSSQSSWISSQLGTSSS
jgi:flagellar hook-associated protein 2